MIVLTQKPHQEHITNIDDFIWKTCVSYRKLNGITKPLQFPIPQCEDAITVLSWGSGKIWIISLDAHQGYHQEALRKIDRDKLAFLPDNRKYCFNVMTFGPINAPPFYTAMMKDLKDEWEKIIIPVAALGTHQNHTITLTSVNEIMIGAQFLISSSKTIVDDTLLWCDDKELIMIYFSCVCKIFLKYRVSFRLDKCEFLKVTCGIHWS